MPIELHQRIVGERRERLGEICGTLFGGTEPFVLEIGSGHGHFLTAYAAAHPLRRCVGIDLVPERLDRAERKRERARLANVHFIRAAAEDLLAVIPPTVRFSDIFVLFPDPWPKRRHRDNRLMRPDFLAGLAAAAGRGARLYLRTDYEPYFAEARAAVNAGSCWREVAAPWPFELPTVFQRRAARFDSLVAERQ